MESTVLWVSFTAIRRKSFVIYEPTEWLLYIFLRRTYRVSSWGWWRHQPYELVYQHCHHSSSIKIILKRFHQRRSKAKIFIRLFLVVYISSYLKSLYQWIFSTIVTLHWPTTTVKLFIIQIFLASNYHLDTWNTFNLKKDLILKVKSFFFFNINVQGYNKLMSSWKRLEMKNQCWHNFEVAYLKMRIFFFQLM